jgi:hypothetical protein
MKPNANKEQRNEGFIYARRYGHYFVVEFLLHQGLDLAAQAGGGQTGLHRATIGAHLEIVKLLLRYNPPLEAKNMFGGTVFGQALWSAGHGGDPDVYIATLEAVGGDRRESTRASCAGERVRGCVDGTTRQPRRDKLELVWRGAESREVAV